MKFLSLLLHLLITIYHDSTKNPIYVILSMISVMVHYDVSIDCCISVELLEFIKLVTKLDYYCKLHFSKVV